MLISKAVAHALVMIVAALALIGLALAVLGA
jgi:hypothetical protein